MIARFFLLTFAISWALWVPLIAAPGAPDAVRMPLVLAGAFGPSAAGLMLAWRRDGRAGLRDMMARTTQLSRIPLPWLAFSLLVFPALVVTVGAVDAALGGTPPPLNTELLGSPTALPGVLVLLILAGPLSEELGWRGWVLDPLQRGRSALTASLVLGVAWGTWHLPLFLIQGTSQASLGFGTAHFWLWMIEVLALAVIYTWVYNRTDRSVLVAVLLHFSGNAAYTAFVPLGADAMPLQTAVISACAHVVLAAVAAVAGGSATVGRTAAPARS